MVSLDDVHSIYFIGIGGVGMSAAAGLAKAAGFDVSGSDSADLYPPASDSLKASGIPYGTPYDASRIGSHDLYVVSAGEGEQNPEVAAVYTKNLPHCGFGELLYLLNRDRIRIVVSGTHGKSTTTGLIGRLIHGIDGSPFMVGAVLQDTGTNFESGDGHYAVFEGDEYKAEFDDPTPKFHSYRADILVLTNLEHDHPDMFSSLAELEAEFDELIGNLPADGLLVYNADDPNLVRLAHRAHVPAASFGIEHGDFQATHLGFGRYTDISVRNRYSKDVLSQAVELTEDYKTVLPGKHNVYNVLAALCCLRALGFSYEQLALDLLAYRGVKRRFEVVADKNGVTVIDDYAHHPTAVRETLAAARLRYPGRNLWAVFEPHTFSRTKALLPELAKAFADADRVVLADIYPARESVKDATVTSEAVLEALSANHRNVQPVHSKAEALELLKKSLKPNDVVVFMVVGNFNRLAYELAAQL